MPKLFQINACLNLSTGRIAQHIGDVALSNGWESWIAYSGREESVPSKSQVIKIGSFFQSGVHYLGQRLFDREGLLSKSSTIKLIEEIKKIKPDIIQLHNIHDHWLNYPMLFEYLGTLNIPVVWVQHDCWSFTGGCMYFDILNCNEWKNGCGKCPDKRTLICNQSTHNWERKRESQSRIKNLSFVCVSEWLEHLMKQSFLNERPIYTIHNGTDTGVFRPIKEKKADD